MGLSKIEWTDLTFNPWWGCERVSPGCAHCYADTLARRYGHAGTWGAGHGFRFFGDKHWAEPLKWARTMPARLGRRPRVFCASMADVFEDRTELVEPRKRLIELVYRTPELDWLMLTKRAENVGRMLGPDGVGLYAVESGQVPCPQPNLWVGVSIENARFTWRADVLRQIPAAVRFLSCEPLLGSLLTVRDGELPCSCWPGMSTQRPVDDKRLCDPWEGGCGGVKTLDLSGIDWCIVGGESGPGARSFDVAWAREIVAECREHGVAPFVKQLGARPVISYEVDGHTCTASVFGIRDRKGGDWNEWDAKVPDLRIREFPAQAAARCGEATVV